MRIVGISAYYHDSAAALVEDGRIVAAAQEERFTRKKHDSRFPREALSYCLAEARLHFDDIDYLVFYDKPLLKFERLLETYLAYAPRGFGTFVEAIPIWLKEKLFLRSTIRRELKEVYGKGCKMPQLLFSEHHQAHAAASFYPSPYERAAVLCMDGVGEWATTSAWVGAGKALSPLWQIDFPHSLGLLYSAFTYYAGFKVNSGEYKLMGLAPYGEPRYVNLIREHLVDIKDDGTYRLNLQHFDFMTGWRMTSHSFDKLFGGPPRAPEGQLTQRHMDIARSIQEVTEEIVLKLARSLHQETGERNLCLAGGVALNCVANGRLLREGPFADVWIQPAAGDAGGALGAALAAWHHHCGGERVVSIDGRDSMQGSYLGPDVDGDDTLSYFRRVGARFARLSDEGLSETVANCLAEEAVIGWCSGRMEFGPRALGARSIIGDPRSPKMQSIMNLKIKFRESFRPFAPAVLEEDVGEYFEFSGKSPYMLMVAPVRSSLRRQMSEDEEALFGIEKLSIPRSTIPAVTHVDYSARLQTVGKTTNPKFHDLLSCFKSKTGCGVLVNTSFNVRGEPIVRTAEDAYRCFMRTNMDYLVVGNYLLAKKDQPVWRETDDWRAQFALD